MVYKKFEKRKGKIFGPYYYESYREDGKVKKRYIGDEKGYQKWLRVTNKNVEQRFSKKFIVGFLSVLLFFSFSFVLFDSGSIAQELYHVQKSISGYSVSGSLVGLTSEQLTYDSYEDESVLESYIGKDIDLEIKGPVKLGKNTVSKNKNNRMEFDAGGDNIRLYFDLLNYSEFVGGVSNVIVDEIVVSMNETSEGVVSNVSEVVEEEEEVVSEGETNESIVSNVTEIVNETAEEFDNETIVVNETSLGGGSEGDGISEQLGNETGSPDEGNETSEETSNKSEVEEEVEMGEETETNESIVEEEIVEEINETSEASEEVVTEETVIEQEEESETELISEEVDETSEETTSDTESSSSEELEESFEEPELEEEIVEEEELSITANVIRGFTGFFLKVVGYDIADIGFNVSEGNYPKGENETNVGDLNESVIRKIKKGIGFDDVQSVVADLTSEELEVIEDEAVVEAGDFEIIVNDSKIEAEKPEYKWGYRVKLHDLNFMAKIEVTANQTISVWDSETLRIGNNLLSFGDLVDAGYSVRIDVPTLEMETEIVEDVLEVNESIEEEEISEEGNGTTEEFDNESLIENETVEVVGNETIINETVEESDNETVFVNESESVEDLNETIWEASNESEVEEEVEIEEEIEGEVEEGIETVEEAGEEVEIEEEISEETSELTITANVIRGILGLVIGVIGGEEINYSNVSSGSEIVVEDVEYEYTVTVYIERDFTNNSENISVGDIIFLDPSLTKISVLNVQSYPTVGGNWEVGFNTTGTANLTITATRDVNYSERWTRWSDYSEDSGLYDLKFLEIMCGNETKEYEWLGGNCSRQDCSVFIFNYSCNETAYEVSEVLTSGKHVLRFDFGNETAYAYNDASPLELDYMEYANNTLAQAAYVSNGSKVVDQSFETGGDPVEVNPIGDVVGVEIRQAMQFTISEIISCSTVGIWADWKNGAVVGDTYIQIETDSSNEPSGTLVHANANGTIALADMVEGNWSNCSFTQFDIPPGTYWLVAYLQAQKRNIGWGLMVDVDGIGTNADSGDGGATWNVRTDSWISYYRVYALPLQSYSESTIKQQGSYSLKVIAQQTDSLNDNLTRTVSPTINLSGYNIINLDVRANRTGSNFKIDIHDSGGTTTEHAVNITSANTWQTESWDISGVSNANKDIIDQIIINITNADAGNTIHIDNMTSIETTTPTVTLLHPANDSINASSTITFGFNTTEDGACSLYLNTSGTFGINTTNNSVIAGNNNFVVNLSDGGWLWNVECNNSDGNYANASENWTLTVDATPPTVTLLHPANDSINASSTITFGFNTTEDGACSLYLNTSGTFGINTTNNSVIAGNNNFVVNLSDGGWLWNVECNDSASNYNNASANWTLTVDTTTPTVTNIIVTPQKALNGSRVNINATVTDNTTVSNVRAEIYYPNSTLWQNLTMDNETFDVYNISIISQFYPHGTYNVTIWANDTSNNVNDSEKTWFAPYLTLGDNQDITIDGTFSDWSGVVNVSDIIGDSNTTTGIVTVLNDSSSAENLTFTGNENKTIYIDVPKGANVTNATLNLTGLGLDESTETNQTEGDCVYATWLIVDAIHSDQIYDYDLNSYECDNHAGSYWSIGSEGKYITKKISDVNLDNKDVGINVTIYSISTPNFTAWISDDDSTWTVCGDNMVYSVSEANETFNRTCTGFTGTDLYLKVNTTSWSGSVRAVIKKLNISYPGLSAGDTFYTSNVTLEVVLKMVFLSLIIVELLTQQIKPMIFLQRCNSI